MMAGAFVMTLPLIITFFLFQCDFVQGITLSGLGGRDAGIQPPRRTKLLPGSGCGAASLACSVAGGGQNSSFEARAMRSSGGSLATRQIQVSWWRVITI